MCIYYILDRNLIVLKYVMFSVKNIIYKNGKNK